MSESLHYKLPEHLAARRSAQRSEWTVQIVGVVIAVVAIVGASLLIGPVNKIRRKQQLVINPKTVAGLPPGIALLSKTGTFRALAIDWASIRAERLKNEGKTYEALQLHQTVCALAPRYPMLWAYAAWNMSYNISVMQYTPEARWKWVENGITILRDEGIVYNPEAVALYKELAWIYWHKIGDFLDDEHMNYKRALAVEMERVLGPPPTQWDTQTQLTWFKKIVDAPRDLDKLIHDNADVSAVVDMLAKEDLKPDITLLDFVARYIRPELMASDLYKNKMAVDSKRQRRMEILQNPKYKEPVDTLIAAVRSQVLRKDMKFDLDYMYKIMVNRYGPLDWRTAYAHALYWASYGDDVCKGYQRNRPADAMNTARLVFFSLGKLVTDGRMTLYPDFDDPFNSYLSMGPDTRYIPYLYQTYMRLGKEQFGDDPRFIEGTPGPNYMTGFVTAMQGWIQYLYLEGGEKNIALANQYFAWLREHNPAPDGSTQEQYKTSAEEFVVNNIRDQLETYRAASAIIRSLITQALKHYSFGQSHEAFRFLVRARQCYDIWMNGADLNLNDRAALQRPKVILRDQVELFMKNDIYSPLFKARLWKSLPLEQRQMVYDVLKPTFEAICNGQDPKWSLERAFPEPAGMEEARKNLPDYRSPAHRTDVEEGKQFKQ